MERLRKLSIQASIFEGGMFRRLQDSRDNQGMGNSYPMVVETQESKLNLDRTQTEGIIYHLITPTVCAPVLSP